MEIFGATWDNYEERIKENWLKSVKQEDIVIIPGDISWATTMEEAYEDFAYIDKLPGEKILIKGNHDYYFSTVTKVEKFLKEKNFNSIKILHNTAIELEKYALCGTRGWGNNENGYENVDNEKVIKREEQRLILSLEYAKRNFSEKKIIVAMHFPPFIGEFQNIMRKYDVEKCIYGHLHGYGHSLVKEGNIDGIEYIMVSCDYTNFNLIKLD